MDLDKIILEETRSLLKKEGNRIILDELCRNAMKEAIRQALELACERAEAKVFMPSHQHLHMTDNAIVNRDSIMSIMDEL